jgi:anti-sigma-K factor RskA
MTSHDELLDNVAAYALGVLPASEAAEVESRLRTCERCRDEYRFLRPAVTAVAYSAQACPDSSGEPPVASPLLKARVMKQVRAEAARRSAPRFRPVYAVAAASLAIAVVSIFGVIALSVRLDRERAQSAAQAQAIADLTAPDSRRHSFARGEVLTRGDRLYLAMHDLPAPPAGHVYQAWTLAKGAASVAPSITFAPADGVAVVRLPESAATIAAVAVSVEPAGGSKQPTTKPIALVRI